jgi:hypothetical protein
MAFNKKKIILWGIGFLLFIVGSFAAYAWLALHWSYSKGERNGFVQKFSHKGWFCKTWEGELSMVQLPGAIPEKFIFSVRDDEVAQRVNKTMGKRVNLFYEQHIGVPTTCFGETEYFVTDVKTVE